MSEATDDDDARLLAGLDAGRPLADVAKSLRRLGQNHPVNTPDGARAVAGALRRLCESPDDALGGPPLREAANLFQSAATREAATALREEALPHLLALYDRAALHGFGDRNVRLFLLKIFGMYRTDAGCDRVVAAAREPFEPDNFVWSVVLRAFDADHPLTARLIDRLADPLPPGFLGVSLLDCANALARGVPGASHPFATAAGVARLEAWLASSDPEEFSFAHSATAALPFVPRPDRDRLMALAMDHLDRGVQIEAAWAAAKLGNARGIDLLAAFCGSTDLVTEGVTVPRAGSFWCGG